MNKWLVRLEALEHENISDTPALQHCQNRQNGLLSVLAGGWEESAAEFSGSPNPRDRDRYQARVDRLRRWGWSGADAAATAERLARRDAGDDDRVICAAECTHYRPGRCGNHKLAGLLTAELGRDLAGLLQRCPGAERKG